MLADTNSAEDDENEDDEDEGGQTTSNFTKTGELPKKKGEQVEEPRFEISHEDRIMRNRDRYLINPSKHPGYQIEDAKKTVI